MGRRNWGKSLINAGTPEAQILYFSASSLTTGDPDSEDGCLRKWWYERVRGMRAPETAAMKVGTQLHAEIEDYLKTGVNGLGSLAMRGKFMLPTPGDDLLIEHDIVVPVYTELTARDFERVGQAKEADKLRDAVLLSDAPLKVHGIPLVGYIDLVHGRGTNQGVTDIEDVQDPENTVEVIDHKTTSKVMYIKTPEVMSKTIQMTIYGKWVTTTMPATEHVRLSHCYYVTKGAHAPRKVTLRVLPEQLDRQWARVDRVAGSLVDVARESDPDKVPANTRACSAYGGCPHRGYCRAGAQESLTNFFGAGAENILKRLNKVTTAPVSGAPKKTLLGLKKPATAAAPVAITAAAEVDPAVMKAALLRLAREEVEAQYPGIPAAWDEFLSLGVGHPLLKGELARVVLELRGLPAAKDATIPGTGKLAEQEGEFDAPLDLPALVGEIRDFMAEEMAEAQVAQISTTSVEEVEVAVAETADAPVSLLPPDAPASDPLLASLPPEDHDAAPSEETPVVAEVAVTEAAPVKRGRGRPKKVPAPVVEATPTLEKHDEPPTDVGIAVGVMTSDDVAAPRFTAASVTNVVNVAPSEKTSSTLALFINCTPRFAHESTHEMINAITAELNARSGPVGDYRLVANSHDLAYGRWKGLTANMVRALELEDQFYTVDSSSDIGSVVAETLQAIVESRGGLVVVGGAR